DGVSGAVRGDIVTAFIRAEHKGIRKKARHMLRGGLRIINSGTLNACFRGEAVERSRFKKND
ncbi:hypothetical protein, partial [Pseudomonas viridiflava]